MVQHLLVRDLAFLFLGGAVLFSRKQIDFFNSVFQKSPTLKRLSSWPPTARTVGIGLMRWVGSIAGEEDWHKGSAFAVTCLLSRCTSGWAWVVGLLGT